MWKDKFASRDKTGAKVTLLFLLVWSEGNQVVMTRISTCHRKADQTAVDQTVDSLAHCTFDVSNFVYEEHSQG